MNPLIEKQERVVVRLKQELGPLQHQETEAKRLWTIGYSKFLSATRKLNERQQKGLTTDPVVKGVKNKTVQDLWDTLNGWTEKSRELTKRRDAARKAMDDKKAAIVEQENRLSVLLQEVRLSAEQEDNMIDKVFMLNDNVVSALELMDKFLSSNVFPLLSEKGTQKTIDNSTLTKRLVVMTNSITIMDVAKVEEARVLIDQFFERINPTQREDSKDETLAMLSSLLKELLVVKIRVKAGPNLSKFLALDLDEKTFPELKKSQVLLASATNYARSGLYVRLYEREHLNDAWVPVRQSGCIVIPNRFRNLKILHFIGILSI